VEQWFDVIAIERAQGYTGVYHVLNGAISPLDGIGPDDITIEALISRVYNGVEEIIFALNQTPEGEGTSAYIASKLKGYTIKVTCLARGLPVGSSVGSMDRVTVFKAISERRPY
jgi:recombination protein RecR